MVFMDCVLMLFVFFRLLTEGAEKRLDTVMEYYCKKGRGEQIKDIIESMPTAGTHQAYLYYVQAHINANELDKAESVLEKLEENEVYTKQPYELLLHAYSNKKDWDGVLRVVRKMEDYGFPANHETMMKMHCE